MTEKELLDKAIDFIVETQEQNDYICEQMCEGDTTVNRLIQGDVGSGKTIVAFLCLLLCVANGYQGALGGDDVPVNESVILSTTPNSFMFLIAFATQA